MSYKKKLIEVALPLPEINDASAYDKMPGVGPHPKGIHHWWARLPLPTARAVLFASVLDDPSEHPEQYPTEAHQAAERERLFEIIRRLMQKRLHEHLGVYAEARSELLRQCDGVLPEVLDPFAGGGSIPLEARRLGFHAIGSDLNPIAVLLNKVNLELVPRWAGQSAVNPVSQSRIGSEGGWGHARGLAEDVRYYADVIEKGTRKRIGSSYPNVTLPKALGGGEARVIAWIWGHTVASPDPSAKGRHVPVVSSFLLSGKEGKCSWVEPFLDDREPDGWGVQVRQGNLTKSELSRLKLGTKAGKAKDFVCLLTKSPISRSYIQAEGKAGRLRHRMLAIVAESSAGRLYLAPTRIHEETAAQLATEINLAEARATLLSGRLPTRAEITGGVCSAYGLATWGHLFTSRQLLALLTLSDLVRESRARVVGDAVACGWRPSDANEYADSVCTLLALAIDRCADFNNALCRWSSSNQKVMNLFGKQALPMVFDFAEANTLGEAVGAWKTCANYVADCIGVVGAGGGILGAAQQGDAASQDIAMAPLLVSTDPPYYNNISYATLSDFFYVWLRRSLGEIYPEVFGTVQVPKMQELIAAPDRFQGDRTLAREHFQSGFRKAFTQLRSAMDPRFPLTVYYAFKQENEDGDSPSGEENGENAVDLTTGWETMLEGLIGSGFQITATWPVRASQKWRMVSMGTNALASYIILACRPRSSDAPVCGRRDFLAALRAELPTALKRLQQGNVAPVDLAQASIGPGMAVYSRYGSILESDGTTMPVRAALALIHQVKDEVLGEAESDYDAYTRWALNWYDLNGFVAGQFGDANLLANAHAVAVAGLRDAGIVHSRSNEVRLLKPEELPKQWKPNPHEPSSIWLMTHQLIRLYCVQSAGDVATAQFLRGMGARGELARDLAHRLFAIAERRKRTQEAQAYNMIGAQWSELARLAQMPATAEQPTLI